MASVRCLAEPVLLPSTPLPAAPQVLEAEYDAQRNIAPFLENRVLRRIVQVGP